MARKPNRIMRENTAPPSLVALGHGSSTWEMDASGQMILVEKALWVGPERGKQPRLRIS